MSIKLSKSRIALEKVIKNTDIGNQKANVILCIDVSGSMAHNITYGSLQRLFERILPIAIRLDTNHTLEVYTFSTSAKKAKDVTLENYEDYVEKNIKAEDATVYSKGIHLIINDILESKSKNGFYETISKPIVKKQQSWIDKIFFRKPQNEFVEEKVKVNFDKQKTIHKSIEEVYFTKNDLPYFVIFVTDGENAPFDEHNTLQAINQSTKLPIFWKFVGIGYQNFSLLKRIDNLNHGGKIDNAHFYDSKDLLANDKEVNEEELYDNLLKQFPEWLRYAKEHFFTYYDL